jgi:radical SAM superfamily enzyme YgiQ (UPF0313 family)
MNILLVQPRVSAEPAYPLALAGIIPLLEDAGHTVSGLDLCFDSISTISEHVHRNDIAWVGATVLHHNAESVLEWMWPLRQIPNVKTFVAGALPTLDPLGALARTGADFAIVGPPEVSTCELINAQDPHGVPGIVSRHRSTVIPRNQPSFTSLPLPDRRVFPVEQYSHAMRSTALPYAQVVTSRGCDRHCGYCPVPQMRPLGFDPRTPERVLDEWMMLIREHGIRSIHVEDDNFLADRERVLDLCDRLVDAGTPVVWELVNGVRPDQVDPTVLKAMASAGCNRIVFSFEHIQAQMSPAIGYTWDQSKNAVDWAKALNMRVGGYFILGLPGESLPSTLLSIRYALQLGLDDANWVPFYESPGSGFSGCASTIDSTAIPREHAERLTKAATVMFFANPKTFGRLGSEMVATPATLPALAEKAVELLRAGGPVPLRDSP